MYCSRTIPEIEKCVEELRSLYDYYSTQTNVSHLCNKMYWKMKSAVSDFKSINTSPNLFLKSRCWNAQYISFQHKPDLLAVAMSARKNLCVNESVLKHRQGKFSYAVHFKNCSHKCYSTFSQVLLLMELVRVWRHLLYVRNGCMTRTNLRVNISKILTLSNSLPYLKEFGTW